METNLQAAWNFVPDICEKGALLSREGYMGFTNEALSMRGPHCDRSVCAQRAGDRWKARSDGRHFPVARHIRPVGLLHSSAIHFIQMREPVEEHSASNSTSWRVRAWLEEYASYGDGKSQDRQNEERLDWHATNATRMTGSAFKLGSLYVIAG